MNALHEYDILDSLPEQAFDDITKLATLICGTPISLVSLVDEARQWFKSRVGLDAIETHRDYAFCAHAILEPDILVVPNAAIDVRFADNPLVAGDPRIRFYAGAPLVTPDGFSLGTLCVIDSKPRELTPEQLEGLQSLSRQVIAQLELRKRAAKQEAVIRELKEAEASRRIAEELALERTREIEILNERLNRSMTETHHRVKNNLQVISALVELQSTDGELAPAAALTRIGQHARALAAIHDLLTHETKGVIEADHVSVKAAMDKLVPLLQSTAGSCVISYHSDEFRLPMREGGALAMLVSELVSNAIKHGNKRISIALTADEGLARLEVCDDGPGFPDGFDWRTAANTGLSLIDSTGRHDLRGSITYNNRPEGGAQVVVVFPLPALVTS